MIDNGRKLGYFAGFMKFWKTIIAVASVCLAGGFWETTAQELIEPEMLEVHYTDSGGTTHAMPVEKDVETLKYRYDITELTLPEGLTKLHSLEIYRTEERGISLNSLRLPKDLGKEADWPLRLVLGTPITLQVHKEMGPFSLWFKTQRGNGHIFWLPMRISPAKKLIRNREPDDDGVFRITMNASSP